MQQQISVITLAVADLARSRRFYAEGFGWAPVFDNEEIAFYQMNGFVFGTWQRDAFDEDLGTGRGAPGGGFSLAHNVAGKAGVQPLMNRLASRGGTVVRPADAPAHGGFRGYIADPDEHIWEIAWNPTWPISVEGYVSFGM